MITPATRNVSWYTRILVCILALVLTLQPVLLSAQTRRTVDRTGREEDRSRTDRDRSSRQYPDQTDRGATGLQVDIARVGKAAYDAVIRSGRYILGPGDVFVILAEESEQGQEVHNIPVSAEGSLIIPRVGAIPVAGLSLSQARAAIDSALQSRFRIPQIKVSLAHLRTFPVEVLGEVRWPGTYLVHGAEQVSELIAKAGDLREGPESRPSRRNIQIRRLSEAGIPRLSGRKADLDLWRISGNVSDNPFLLDGDQVYVPVRGDSISISGGVSSPGNYEYAPGDRIADLLRLGGINSAPENAGIRLLRLSPETPEPIELDLSRVLAGDPQANLELRANDKLHVEIAEQRVTIEGEVYFPGAYPVVEGLTLKQLIQKAGGFTARAALSQSSIIRRGEQNGNEEEDTGLTRLLSLSPQSLTDDQRDYLTMKTQQSRGRLPVDFAALFQNNEISKENDILLKGGDVIRVPRLIRSVQVNGFVITPGAVPYDSTYAVSDYIQRAGGFNERARNNDVFVIKASTGNWVNASENVRIDAGDEIHVPGKKPGEGWRIFRETLTVLTQVATLILIIQNTRR